MLIATALVLLVGVVILWNFRLDQAPDGGRSSHIWGHDGTARLRDRAQAALDGDPPDYQAAADYASEAIAASPLNLDALQLLSDATATTDPKRSSSIASLLAERTHRLPSVLQTGIAHAANVSDFDKLVDSIDAMIRITADNVHTSTIKSLIDVVNYNPGARAFVSKRLASNPPWRDEFLDALAQSDNTDLFPEIAPPIEASPAEAMSNSWRIYLRTLILAGKGDQAYAIWMSSLPADQPMPYVYNGDFSMPLSGSPFDWTFARVSGVEMSIDRGGANDKPVLRVNFGGAPVQFAHVYQNLLLAPGTYQFHSRYRSDDLETARGLQWRLYCRGGAASSLAGYSQLMFDSKDWAPVVFSFTIPPEGCGSQALRLELPARNSGERQIRGTFISDSVEISRDTPS